MRSTWNELESPLRVSAMLGVTGAVSLLYWTWPILSYDLSAFNTGGGSGVDLSFFVLLVEATPILAIFMLLGSALLLFKPMSQENRGVLGFLVFILGILGIVPTLLIVGWLLQVRVP